jgi:hypothetical protein
MVTHPYMKIHEFDDSHCALYILPANSYVKVRQVSLEALSEDM